MKKLLMFGVAAIAAATSQGAAKDLPRLDSSKFDFCYEFIKSPTEEDLDDNGVADMIMNNADGNWLTCGSQSAIGYGVFTCTEANRYIGSNQDGGVWRNYGVSSSTGFTIETRLVIASAKTAYGPIALTASANDSKVNALVNFTTNAITWGNNNDIVLTNLDMKTSYHTCRIARAGGTATYSVWVDDNLVAENLGDGLSSGSVLNRILIGSIGSAWKGSAAVSYLRFTKGGYAPLNEKDRRRDSEDFDHKYEMDVSDARFSPTATTSDWQLGSGEQGTAILSDGVLHVDQPSGKMRYYVTTGPMDASISASSPFTFEIRTRINSAWAGASIPGCALSLFLGTPRASSVFYIGTNTVCGTDYKVVHTGDNSDKMHVFRIVYKGEYPNSYTIYRDGEKIADGLKPFNSTGQHNFARFGIASTGTHGGAFDVDYVRWTTDGAFTPPKPKKGIIISFH